mmetsp:Transcript_62493/g.140934  ORF Transcript_62493/g.140934 Transcript_62493/m.140934 type:complete len:203 (-) Transcript_62493:222-830(-)
MRIASGILKSGRQSTWKSPSGGARSSSMSSGVSTAAPRVMCCSPTTGTKSLRSSNSDLVVNARIRMRSKSIIHLLSASMRRVECAAAHHWKWSLREIAMLRVHLMVFTRAIDARRSSASSAASRCCSEACSSRQSLPASPAFMAAHWNATTSRQLRKKSVRYVLPCQNRSEAPFTLKTSRYDTVAPKIVCPALLSSVEVRVS